MLDLDSIKSYNEFLTQIKHLGMTRFKHNYVLVTLVILIGKIFMHRVLCVSILYSK